MIVNPTHGSVLQKHALALMHRRSNEVMLSSARRCLELRPVPDSGDENYPFRLRLLDGASELSSWENASPFGPKARWLGMMGLARPLDESSCRLI